MDANATLTADRDLLTQEEVEHLLSEVTEQEATAVLLKPDGTKRSPFKESLRPFDFRQRVFSSAQELRKLRVQHERFIRSLSARLSIYLRLDFGLQLSNLETLTFEAFTNRLSNPTHLSLFRIEPLPGISVLEMSLRLGLTIVDRLVGGPGHSANLTRDLSEIETALLAHVVQLIMGEWCSQWTSRGDLRPVLLGHENNGRFLQNPSPATAMLVLSMEARVGHCVEAIQIAVPYSLVEPLIERIIPKLTGNGEKGARPQRAAPPQWRSDFDDVKVPLTAEWGDVEVTTRQLALLKEGDLLMLRPEFAEDVRVHLAGRLKFRGRLGVLGKKRAVEVSELLKKRP
jgi:flagellar motor switch protein FliM